MALLSIQINHYAGTPKHNNYKRHDEARIQLNLLHRVKDRMGVVQGPGLVTIR